MFVVCCLMGIIICIVMSDVNSMLTYPQHVCVCLLFVV